MLKRKRTLVFLLLSTFALLILASDGFSDASEYCVDFKTRLRLYAVKCRITNWRKTQIWKDFEAKLIDQWHQRQDENENIN
ncbi:hypothetical protein J5I95_13860 [Candidatus Poribacteria bacterium]|nr:hypothetical protein [Candidatus Poribacteria bacterium]